MTRKKATLVYFCQIDFFKITVLILPLSTYLVHFSRNTSKQYVQLRFKTRFYTITPHWNPASDALLNSSIFGYTYKYKKQTTTTLNAAKCE